MKVFIHKITGEYGHYSGKGEFLLSTIPQIFPDTMNTENFCEHVKNQEGCKLQHENFTVKKIKFTIID